MTSIGIDGITANLDDNRFKFPASLDFHFPNGDFPIKNANEYESQYTDEYLELYEIFYRWSFCGLRSSQREYYKKFEENILFKKFPELGKADSVYRIICSFIAGSELADIPYFERERVSLVNILEQTRIKFLINTFATLASVFISSVVEYFLPANYLYYEYESCSASRAWHVVTLSSFNQSCGYIPMKMLLENYPLEPVRLGASCDGIASGITNTPATDLFTAITIFLVPVLWIFFALHLADLEIQTKKFIRASVGSKGVFIPCADKCKTLSSKSILKDPSCIINWYIYLVPILLSLLQFLSIFLLSKTTKDWFIFPSFASQVNFTRDSTYSTYLTAWCGLLPRPIHLTYRKYSSPTATQFLQAILVFLNCYIIISHSRNVFKWMDSEIYMMEDKKRLCCYYDIHQNRSRVFNEPILYDWFVINIQYPIVYSLLHDSKYEELRKKISPQMTLKLTTIMLSIASKHGKMKNAFSNDNLLAQVRH